ncbi:hypothetical protein [Paraburkholderia sp. 40]|uniref:hypothetical protein n=1 Tax=Paraburkholderia sp. 40 TaxID=2991059 RepID=UPI003D198263
MRKIVSIPVQKLFLVTLALKVVSSGIGWLIGDPWFFGLVIPITIMGLYIVIGWKRIDSTVSDEKFADSCYYIGFIFTITSIIFSLLDLPNIGTRMSLISVRFGTAMISTVLGLMVRVYWVSFRQDVGDAVQSAEEGVVDATHRLREQLTIALEQFRDFQSQVQDATSMSIAKVSVGVEELTKSYAAKLSEFFQLLANENTKVFKGAQSEVHQSSQRLARSVDGYSDEIRKSLGSIEKKVVQFTDVVTRRLENTTFPDDYFAQQLAAPLAKLGLSTSGIADDVNSAAEEIKSTLVTLRDTFSAMRARTDNVEPVFERLVDLAQTQEALLAGSQAHVDTLGVLNSTLRAAQDGLGSIRSEVAAQSRSMDACIESVNTQTSSIERVAVTLSALDTALSAVMSDANRQQERLASVAAGATEQSLALGRVSECVAGLTDVLDRVAASVEHNSKDVGDLARQLKDESTSVRDERAASRESIQRLAASANEVPHLRAAVHRLTEQLADFLQQMRSSADELPTLVRRPAAHDASGGAHPLHSVGGASVNDTDAAPVGWSAGTAALPPVGDVRA